MTKSWRGPKADWHYLYNTRRWKELRLSQLRACPMCVYCRAAGRDTAANVVDHIKAHKGDTELFHDPANLQSLCQPCHDAIKKTFELSGVLPGCGLDGRPLDPAHHWRR